MKNEEPLEVRVLLEHTIKVVGEQCASDCHYLEYENRLQQSESDRVRGWFCKLFNRTHGANFTNTPERLFPLPRRTQDCIIVERVHV